MLLHRLDGIVLPYGHGPDAQGLDFLFVIPLAICSTSGTRALWQWRCFWASPRGGDVPAVETFSTPPGGGAVSPGWASIGGADSAAGAWAAPGWSASWVGSWFSGFGRTLILKRCLRKFRIVTD